MARNWINALAAATVAAAAAPAQAQGNWGERGPEDQLGTLNYSTPAVRMKAATHICTGAVFNVAIAIK